ncbi:MAG: two-component regulator propeller domain-containing protein [Bacteroidota bacterium]
MKRILLFVFQVFFFELLFAQKQLIRFDSYNYEEGLSNSYVTAIVQDKLGFLWFGTKDGLNKFDGYNFQAFKHNPKQNNILRDDYITCLESKQDSVIWVGTENGGVCKFLIANEKFECLTQNNSLNTVAQNRILCLWEEEFKGEHLLWIGTNGGGLRKYNINTNQYTNFTRYSSNENSISSNIVRTIGRDSNDLLWVGTEFGLNCFDYRTNYWSIYLRDPKKANTISDNTILSMHLSPDGIRWVGTENGLIKIQINTQKAEKANNKNLPNITIKKFGEDFGTPKFVGNEIKSLHEDAEGFLWIGTFNGLNKFDPRKGITVNYFVQDFANPYSIAGNMITSIFQDRSGVLWFGTGGNGISKLNPTAHNFSLYMHIPGSSNSLSNPSLRGILIDEDDVLWVGGYGGLNRIDRHSNIYKHYLPQNSGLTSDLIYAISEDTFDKKILWIGTEGGGLFKFNKLNGSAIKYTVDGYIKDAKSGKSLSSNFVFDVYIDSAGLVWLATNNGLNIFDSKTEMFKYVQYETTDTNSLSSNGLRAIYEDNKGEMWISTISSGLNRLNKKTGKVVRFYNSLQNPNSLSNNRVRCIFQDSGGILWFGTIGGGLIYLTPENYEEGIFKSFTARDGLSNNTVVGILEDDSRNLWMSTNWGISKLNYIEKEFTNFDVNDGLQSNEFNSASYFKSRTGEMFFGGINGMNSFQPEKMQKRNFHPPVSITNFQLFYKSVPIGTTEYGRIILNKSISHTEEIVLDYSDNMITFEFAALSYSAPENNKYAFKLEGFNDDWIYTSSSRRLANFTHLDPGKYVFRVKAANEFDVWNEEGTAIKISIAPPPWNTWWAYLAYFLFAAGSTLGIIRWRIMRLKILTNRLEHEVKIRTREIENQKKKIEIQAEKLSELDKLKSRFFANISHEFRTPLTLIKGSVEDLMNNSGNDKQGESQNNLHLALSNVSKLKKLIDELLDLSKLESGKMKLRVTEIDLNMLIQRTIDAFHAEAERRQIQIIFKPDAQSIPLYVDVDKFEKVIINLLSNAIKFSSKGKKITITCLSNCMCEIVENGTGCFVTLTIADEGIGIEEKAFPYIFDRFYQADSSITRKYEGSGIGLALCKEFVELHGGEISVESKEGIGSTFTILVPKGYAHYSDYEIVGFELRENEIGEEVLETNLVTEDEIEIPPVTKGKYKVLIVEDNFELRKYIAQKLSTIYSVSTASNGKEGYAAAIEIEPHLIVSDIMMPEMAGLEMTKLIKQNKKICTTPIILLTSRAELEDRIAGFVSCADDYITKPFSFDELKARIQNLIEGREFIKSSYYRRVVIIDPDKVTLTPEDSKFIESLKTIVENNIADQKLNVQTLAENVFLSRRQLERKINSITGQSPAEFIRQLRLTRSKQHLINGSYNTVAETAYSVGFDNIKYFSRLFFQAYSKHPSELLHKED